MNTRQVLLGLLAAGAATLALASEPVLLKESGSACARDCARGLYQQGEQTPPQHAVARRPATAPAAPPPPLPPKMLHVRGVDLAYVEQGRGQPVVLIHGFLLDYRSWVMQMGALARGYHVIAYSKRYRYPNQPPAGGFDNSKAANVEDLAALIRGLKLGRVHLIGHSAGAGLAMLFARRHPEMVRSLVLGEGPPPLPDSAGQTGAAAGPPMPSFIAEAHAAYERGDVEGALKIFADGVLGPQHAPLPDFVHRMALDNAWLMGSLPFSDRSEPPFTCSDARHIRAPILVMQGELSPAFLLHRAEGWLKCRPTTEHAILRHASHGLEFDNPGDFNRIVLKFLHRHRGATPPAQPTKR